MLEIRWQLSVILFLNKLYCRSATIEAPASANLQPHKNSFWNSRSVVVGQRPNGRDITGQGSNTWWRHEMETFSALLAICAGNSPVTGESHRPETRSFDVFFDLRVNKRLSKQPLGWWFETPSRPLWRHCNVHSQPCRRCCYCPPPNSLHVLAGASLSFSIMWVF